MTHLAQNQHKSRVVYSMFQNFERLTERDVVSHGQIAYRADVPLGAAQGRRGEVMNIVRQVAQESRRRPVLDIFNGAGLDGNVTGSAERVPSWLTNLARPEIARSPDVLKQTMDSLLGSLIEEGPESVNEQLARVDVKVAHTSHLMAVLRGLFVWRGQMANWSRLRDKAAEEMPQRGLKIEVIMKGLLN